VPRERRDGLRAFENSAARPCRDAAPHPRAQGHGAHSRASWGSWCRAKISLLLPGLGVLRRPLVLKAVLVEPARATTFDDALRARPGARSQEAHFEKTDVRHRGRFPGDLLAARNRFGRLSSRLCFGGCRVDGTRSRPHRAVYARPGALTPSTWTAAARFARRAMRDPARSRPQRGRRPHDSLAGPPRGDVLPRSPGRRVLRHRSFAARHGRAFPMSRP